MLDFFRTAAGSLNFVLMGGVFAWFAATWIIAANIHKHRTDTLSAIAGRTRAEQSQQQEENRRIEAEKRLAAAEEEITNLRPKPLKERVLIWLGGLDPRVMLTAKQGKRVFEESMTEAQKADLQHLCAEDGEARYIIEQQVGTTRLGGGLGRDTNARFTVTEELLK